MKKKVFLFLFLVVFSFSIFAGGTKTNDASSKEKLANTSYTIEGQLITTIAEDINMVTKAVSLAFTPFPSAYYKRDNERNSVTKVNETNIKFSDAFVLSNNALDAKDSAGKPLTDNEKNKEKKIYGIITWIFVACMTLEIIYTALSNYLGEDKGQGIAKTIISKIFTCILLFIVVGCLPYGLELLKDGFVSLAFTITGVDQSLTSDLMTGSDKDIRDKITELSLDINGQVVPININSALMLRDIKKGNIFELPGWFLLNYVNIFENFDPSTLTGKNRSAENNTFNPLADIDVRTNGIIGHLLIWAIFFVVKILLYVYLFFGTLHIMFNIIEVYGLLGISMLLIPFNVFTPSKFFGAGAIKSLITNVIELFIILVFCLLTVSLIINLVNEFIFQLKGNMRQNIPITIILQTDEAIKTGFVQKIPVLISTEEAGVTGGGSNSNSIIAGIYYVPRFDEVTTGKFTNYTKEEKKSNSTLDNEISYNENTRGTDDLRSAVNLSVNVFPSANSESPVATCPICLPITLSSNSKDSPNNKNNYVTQSVTIGVELVDNDKINLTYSPGSDEKKASLKVKNTEPFEDAFPTESNNVGKFLFFSFVAKDSSNNMDSSGRVDVDIYYNKIFSDYFSSKKTYYWDNRNSDNSSITDTLSWYQSAGYDDDTLETLYSGNQDANDGDKNGVTWYSLLPSDKIKVVNDFFNAYYKYTEGGTSKTGKFTIWDTDYSGNLLTGESLGFVKRIEYYLSLILLVVLSVLIPMYFIQKSTHITNAMMTGNASWDRLRNPGMVVRSVGRGINTATKGAVGAVGGVGKVATQGIAEAVATKTMDNQNSAVHKAAHRLAGGTMTEERRK